MSAATSAILGSPACLLNASNRSNSEFSSISTPRLYSCLIGALHAKKFNGLGPKLMIFRSDKPITVLAIGRKSWIISAHSAAVPTGYSGI